MMDLSSHAYPKFPTEIQLDLAVKHFLSGLRDCATHDYLQRERTSRCIIWQKPVQMAQACEHLRMSDRSTSAAFANAASSPTVANFAQCSTMLSNNCAITTPIATSNPRNKYASSSRAQKGNWRAANFGNTVYPPFHLSKFNSMSAAPRCTPPNLYTPNSICNTEVYVRAPFTPQQPLDFTRIGQPIPY